MIRLGQYELVYLGTPYSKYPAGIDAAFRDAAALTAKLIIKGVNVYSPIAHTHPIAVYGGIDPLDHEFWLAFDAAMMAKSDALVVAMLAGWEFSYGLQHEIRVFRSAAKPVFRLDPTTLALTRFEVGES